MNLFRLAALLLALLSAPAAAQWQVPNHSVPMGRGAGVQGFGALGPCLAGIPFVGAGVASDPACGPLNLAASGAVFGILPTADLPNIPVANLNSGTNASASTYWRGDGTWATTPADLTGTTSVAGTNTTYTAGQNRLVVFRSNAGGAMGDLLPGTGAGILAANTLITITNTDPSGIIAIKAAAGALIKTQTSLTGFVYVCPGQSVSFYSDGSNYYATKLPGLCALQADTVINIATTGSDINDGLTAATSMLTLQNAWNLARQTFNANGKKLTLQFADGTYTGSSIITLSGQVTGQICRRGVHDGTGDSLVWVQGNVTTPANVILTTSNVNTLIVSDGACVVLKSFRLATGNVSGYELYVQNAFVDFYAMDFAIGGNVPQMVAAVGGSIVTHAPYSISGGGGCHMLAGEGGSIQEFTLNLAAANITMSNSPVWASGFACAQHSGSIVMSVPGTYVGTASTGPRYSAFLNGVINTGGGGAAFFPGSVAGSTTTGGQYN